MGLNKFIKDSIAFLDSLKPSAISEAKKMFPDHPVAQEIWVKLKTGNGGVTEVVETLSLQDEYNAYKEQFDSYLDSGLVESASLCVGGFVNYCLEELSANFYMFK